MFLLGSAEKRFCGLCVVIAAKARLQGCRAFGELSGSAEFAEDRAVVERRMPVFSGRLRAGLEQAAEGNPCLHGRMPTEMQAVAEEGGAGMIIRFSGFIEERALAFLWLSFPPRGNE